MSTTASITGNHFLDSGAIVGGAAVGSYFASLTANDLAAWSTLIGAVGSLAYQFARLFVDAKSKSLEEANRLRQIELDSRHKVPVLAAQAETQAAKLESAGLRERLARAEAEVDRLLLKQP